MGNKRLDVVDNVVNVETVGAVATQTKEEVVPMDDFYTTNPEACPDDLVINTSSNPLLLPTGDRNNSTIRLREGERLRGKYFAEMVTKHKVFGLQLVKKCHTKFLVDLELKRKQGTNEEPAPWVKEAYKLKEEKK